MPPKDNYCHTISKAIACDGFVFISCNQFIELGSFELIINW